MFDRSFARVFHTARMAYRAPSAASVSPWAARLPLRPLGQRAFASSHLLRDAASRPTQSVPHTPAEVEEEHKRLAFQSAEPRLSLTFTCTVTDCGTRSTHEFARSSYERGIVLVQCPGCKNRHLIADHLGWFKESTEEGRLKTVEDLMRERGEEVRRGRINANGDIEYAPDS